ncbi:MAG: metallophosphoesterase family protein [Acutalibacteraceae bacterium]
MSNIIQKIISTLLALMITAGILPAPLPPSEGIDADAELVFANDDEGSAAGTVTVNANFDTTYSLFWGDANSEKLSASLPTGKTVPYTEFANVAVENGVGESALNSFLAIPYGAETVLLYYKDELLDSDAIPESKIADYGDATYSFASLSDVHFNRYFTSGGDDSEISYLRALNFVNDMGVSIVGISGDISNNGETAAYESFNRINSGFDFPVFSCKGNHDCKRKFTYDAWNANVNPGVFTSESLDGVLAKSDNGYDFVYSGSETHGDVFIFLSQISDKYAKDVPLLTDEQLDWLAEQFETYQTKRVYLYFHTFLTAPEGNPSLGEGNLVNDYGFSYTSPYYKGNKDECRFRDLLTQYKNVIWFNGHSHWAYSLEKYNPFLNITDYGGTTATMVHVSSTGAPRTTGITEPIQTSKPLKMSEGLFNQVYDDFIIVNACDFVNGRILAYAVYKINN